MGIKTTTEKEIEKIKRLNFFVNLSEKFQEVGPSVGEAAQSLIIALQYKDKNLQDSATHSLLLALQEFIQKSVDDYMGVSENFCKALDETRFEMRGNCFDDIDEFGRTIIEHFNHYLQALSAIQKSAFMLQKMDYEILRLDRLQFEIDGLRSMKEKFLEDWPLFQSVPSLDRDMIERSRIAYERGDYKSIDDLIGQL